RNPLCGAAAIRCYAHPGEVDRLDARRTRRQRIQTTCCVSSARNWGPHLQDHRRVETSATPTGIDAHRRPCVATCARRRWSARGAAARGYNQRRQRTGVQGESTMAVEPLIFELAKPGRSGTSVPEVEVPEQELPAELVRDSLKLPEVSEIDVIRHYTRLSQKNHAIDINFYPLGSCTMKYNPKINELVARMPGFAHIHPFQDPEDVQGALEVMYELQELLAEISGFDNVTLQPAAGAHGELTGVLIARAYHEARGDHQRRTVIVPDSAHGTNPATAAMAGFNVVELKSDARGNADLDRLREIVGPDTAALMITNPSTLGLWDENIEEIVEIVHEAGGLVYNDGANFNAILGIIRPGDLGIDIMHFNLHKTFSTPHGGGGP